MAKKKDDNSSLIVIAFIILIALLKILILLVNILYLIGWIYYNKKVKELGKVRSVKDFDLTYEEINKLNKDKKNLNNINCEISHCLNKGSHLSTRQDGYFYERSKLGKELNLQLKKLLLIKENLEESIEFIEYLPEKRKKQWIHYNSMKEAVKISFYLYIFIIIVFILFKPNFVVEFGQSMNSENIQELGFTSIFYASSGISLLISGVIFILKYFMSSISYKKKFEKDKNVNNG